jgi:predicted transcriptional regulator
MAAERDGAEKIWRVLDDEKSMKIFKYMCQDRDSYDRKNAMNDLGLTKKEYYTRLENMKDAGLFLKEEGLYRPTSLCKVVQRAVENIESYDRSKSDF